MAVRRTIDELVTMAVNDIGFFTAIAWKSVTGSCVPRGGISARCRVGYLIFTGWAPAERFSALMTATKTDRLPRERIREVLVEEAGTRIVGVAVPVVLSPDSDNPRGLRRGPRYRDQRGYQRFFQRQATAANPPCPWWDHELGDAFGDDDRFEPNDLRPGRDYAEWQADELLERELDRLEAAYDEKLWSYGVIGRRTKYAPKLGSVQELFDYARKQNLDPEEFARRNKERQAEQWVSEVRARDRQRQTELNADQVEIAATLHTPRRGRTHAADQDWLETEQAIKARKGAKRLYRDAAPRPRWPRQA